jgi:hypothetical protein
VREDKVPKDCVIEQVLQRALIEDINVFLEAGLATAGTNRKCSASARIVKAR